MLQLSPWCTHGVLPSTILQSLEASRWYLEDLLLFSYSHLSSGNWEKKNSTFVGYLRKEVSSSDCFFPPLFSCRFVAIILESYFRCDRSMLCIGLFDFVICWCFSVYNYSGHLCLVVSSLTIQILQTRLNLLSTDLIF